MTDKTNAQLLRDAELALMEIVIRGNKQLVPALEAVRELQAKVVRLTELARSLEGRFAP